MSRLANPGRPLLCYVTDRRSLPLATSGDAARRLVDKIEQVALAGADWIQIREKDLSGRELASLAVEALGRLGKDGPPRARVLLNDRLDVALATASGGAHLGEEGLPAPEARRLAAARGTEDFLLGVSCHSLEAARDAERTGADYVFFGPVFATPSKAAYGVPQGLPALEKIAAALGIPVVAIGGITLGNAASCFSAGARGIAAIRLFQDAADPRAVVAQLRQAAG